MDLERPELITATPSGGGAGDSTSHREEVLRRLLARGVSATTLRALLPDWEPLIVRISTGR